MDEASERLNGTVRCEEIGMKESVIYVLRSGDRVLCEWRDFNGTKQNCIPGGGVEPCDRKDTDYVVSAACREAREELGITIGHCQKLDEFVSHGVKFHVVLVDRWTGTIPVANQDNQNELLWIPLEILIPTITLEPLRRIVAKLESTEPHAGGYRRSRAESSA